MEQIFYDLYNTILNKKLEGDDKSYTKYLLTKGTNKILKKVGEECTEVIIASKEESKEEQISELCDLLYHLLVLMVDKSISMVDIEQELLRRSKRINNLKDERREILDL